MANTSGLVGLAGLVFNQLEGKLSDLFGRRAFWFVGPATSVLAGMAVRLFGKRHLAIVALARMSRLLATAFSGSVMAGAVLSGVFANSELSKPSGA